MNIMMTISMQPGDELVMGPDEIAEKIHKALKLDENDVVNVSVMAPPATGQAGGPPTMTPPPQVEPLTTE